MDRRLAPFALPDARAPERAMAGHALVKAERIGNCPKKRR